MYVLPDRRGHGIAQRVLNALEDEARLLGVARLLLETGTRQPEAIALYLERRLLPYRSVWRVSTVAVERFLEKRL